MMVRVLLKRAGTKNIKGCQKDAEKIFKTAISVKSASIPNLKIISRREIEVEEMNNKANRIKAN